MSSMEQDISSDDKVILSITIIITIAIIITIISITINTNIFIIITFM